MRIPRPRRARPSAATFALLLALSLPAAAAAAPVIRSEAPSRPPQTLQLEEQWRVGGDEGDLLFGTVTDFAVDGDGNLYLLDSQLNHVVVVSPEGEHLRTLSGEGDGPGEVRQARDVVVLPDGSIGIMTMFPAKLVRMSRENEPLPSILATAGEGAQAGFTAGALSECRAGVLLLAGTKLAPTEKGQARTHYLIGLDEKGFEKVRYCESRLELDFGRLHFDEKAISPPFHGAVAIGPEGRVFVRRDWNEYAIEVYRPDGALDLVIERDFENRARTADELRRVNALFEASARQAPDGHTHTVEPCPEAIADLHVDADGRLWVLHSRSAEDNPRGVMLSYDLFDRDGRWLRVVRVPCEGDPELDGLGLLPDGRILLMKGLVLAATAQSDLGSIPLGEGEEAGNMEFVCYRVAD